jgi:hypothetical protein
MTLVLAKIENGLITNTILCDEEYAYEFPGYVRIDNLNPQPGPGWSYSNGTFTPPPPAPPPPPQTVFTKFEFRSRFTLQELVSIDNAGANPTLTPEQKGTLNTIGKNFEVATDVDLTHPATIAGIQYLVSVGLLTSQRGTEILTP